MGKVSEQGYIYSTLRCKKMQPKKAKYVQKGKSQVASLCLKYRKRNIKNSKSTLKMKISFVAGKGS